MVNLFANIPAAVVAKQTISFIDAGLDVSNTNIVFEVGSPLKSWKPERAINSVAGFTIDKGYYIVPKVNINFSAYVLAPITLPSNKKNVQPVTSGSYSFAGEWAEGRTGAARRSYWARVNASGHMDGGKPGGIDMNEFNSLFGSTFYEFNVALEKQVDDVTNLLTQSGQRSVFFGQSDHGTTTWDLHPKRYPIDDDHNILGPGVEITGGSTGVEQRQYEWNFGQFKQRPGEPGKRFGSLIQLDMTGPNAGRRRFSCYRSIDGGNTFTPHIIHEQAPGGAGRSETEVVPVVGTIIVLAFIRLDEGGNWQLWKSLDDGLTFTFVGDTNLGWTASVAKVMKAAINTDGTVDFNIMDRPTGWWVHSRNNAIVAQNSHNTGQFNPVDMGYFNDNDDSHGGLGYHSQDMDEEDIRHIIFAKEASNNLTTQLMYTRDDNIDVGLPPNIPALIKSFVTDVSFRVDINLTLYTATEMAKWNTRYFKFGVYSDAAFTTPVTGQYDPASVPVGVLHNIRLPAHFININNLSPGGGSGPSAGKVYYVKFQAFNQNGPNTTIQSIIVTLV